MTECSSEAYDSDLGIFKLLKHALIPTRLDKSPRHHGCKPELAPCSSRRVPEKLASRPYRPHRMPDKPYLLCPSSSGSTPATRSSPVSLCSTPSDSSVFSPFKSHSFQSFHNIGPFQSIDSGQTV